MSNHNQTLYFIKYQRILIKNCISLKYINIFMHACMYVYIMLLYMHTKIGCTCTTNVLTQAHLHTALRT